MAKRLHRASPKTGERRSLHKISAVLAAAGFLNERGKPHPRIDLGAPRGSGALAFRTNWRATAAQTQRQAYVWCNCRRDEVREGSRRARSWCLRDRKSTRLNSSHVRISYAVFCLKKKKQTNATSSKKLQSTTHTLPY